MHAASRARIENNRVQLIKQRLGLNAGGCLSGREKTRALEKLRHYHQINVNFNTLICKINLVLTPIITYNQSARCIGHHLYILSWSYKTGANRNTPFWNIFICLNKTGRPRSLSIYCPFVNYLLFFLFTILSPNKQPAEIPKFNEKNQKTKEIRSLYVRSDIHPTKTKIIKKIEGEI